MITEDCFPIMFSQVVIIYYRYAKFRTIYTIDELN